MFPLLLSLKPKSLGTPNIFQNQGGVAATNENKTKKKDNKETEVKSDKRNQKRKFESDDKREKKMEKTRKIDKKKLLSNTMPRKENCWNN
jgi:hypothetical protein